MQALPSYAFLPSQYCYELLEPPDILVLVKAI